MNAPQPKPEATVHGGRILHVEDSLTVAALVARFLRVKGYRVEHAVNGKQALDMISEASTKFDLVIMDYSMPELDGLECVKAIRAKGFSGKLVVFANALPDGVANQFQTSGVDRILYKSSDFASLDRAIKDLLQPHAGGLHRPDIDQSIMTTVTTANSRTEAPKQRACILYAEDDPFTSQAIARLLTINGYNVESATNGLDALAELMAHPAAYDLIITDQSMPQLTGVEFVQGVRDVGYCGRIIVFAVTLPDDLTDRFRELRVERILNKSGSLQSLLNVIEELVGDRGQK